MGDRRLVGAVHATNVVVVGGGVGGAITFGGELRRPRDSLLDFPELADAAGRGFVGRDAVLAALGAFRRQHRSGYFEVVADAGLGKTALAAEIARRHGGIAFFADASRGLTLPGQLLMHLCAALITRFDLPHQYLPARAGEDSTFLGDLLVEAAAKAPEPVLIVVDALDEAQPPPSSANPLLLPAHLPHGVHAVVTRRPGGGRLLTRPDTPQTTYLILRDAPDQQADIEAYLRRSAADPVVLAALARARPPVDVEAFVARLKAASRGNFMYLSYVLGDMVSPEQAIAALDMDDLPDGLEGYYDKQFWSRMAAAEQEQGWADWNGLYRPVIERLCIAAESVSAEWLGAQIGRPAVEVRERVLQPWARLLGHERLDGRERWHIVHQSFAEFLSEKVDLATAHRALADHYLLSLGDDWARWDDYGLRHVVVHLAQAAARSDPAERPALTARMGSLVLDAGFREAHLRRLRDPSSFERDLELTLRTTAGEEAAPLPALADVALRLVAFRQEQRRVEPIFDLARRGEVQAAGRRLDLFALEVDTEWYRALQLMIAWLAVEAGPQEARQLRDRVRAALARSSPAPALELLLRRVDATLDGVPPPAVALPRPPAPDRARAIVTSLSSSALDRSLTYGASVELLNRSELSGTGGGFLAEDDGPHLVALAAADPEVGEPLLQEYLAIHGAYGYREYRQGSLWALLGAVLRHPRQDWVRTWTPALGAAVLAPNRGDFRESLQVAVLALQVLAGSPGAADEFETHREDVLEGVDAGRP